MNPIFYGRITGGCLIVAVISALLFDRIDGIYQTLMGVVAILAAMISVVTYFYSQYLFRKPKSNTSPRVVSREEGERAIKFLAKQNNMTEAEFREGVNKTGNEIIKKMNEDDKTQ